jgi:hypothetical protein
MFSILRRKIVQGIIDDCRRTGLMQKMLNKKGKYHLHKKDEVKVLPIEERPFDDQSNPLFS